LNEKYFWPPLLRAAIHSLSCTNDLRQFQMVDRINEEIIIKKEEIAVKKELERLCKDMSTEQREVLEAIIKRQGAIIDRMNNGRLRLEDKDNADIQMVANQDKSSLFNFVKFEQQDVMKLLEAGIEAGQEVIKSIGLVE